ncbi:MAG TPA: TfuA domain-containing protein [Kofleriaceae bacterium]|nr:TfuA domain-containing protein [Kofleriaceae bacterium]
MTTIVFVGPTLPAAEVGARLPGARIEPPAAVGDVLRALRRRPARIAIVDGYFERMAAVWHKEILVALGRGVAVWGAASMGALRAAELAPFGMIGVGAIYRAYARGALVADDEVAVAHLPAEHGFRALSDALVNLRFGLERAAAARVISPRTRDRLIELGRARFYRERSWPQLHADGAAAGLPRDQLAALAAWPKPDRKAADARRLLARLARDRGRKPARLAVPRTWALRQLEQLLE